VRRWQVREQRPQIGHGPCLGDLRAAGTELVQIDPALAEVLAQRIHGRVTFGIADAKLRRIRAR